MINIFKRTKKKEQIKKDEVLDFIIDTKNGLRERCNTKAKKISFMFDISRHWNLFNYSDEYIDICFEAALKRYEERLIRKHLMEVI